MSGMQGFKQNKEPSLKSRVRELESMLENNSMAMRILQMSVQQMMQSFQNVDRDISSTMNIANDLQYRTLAMLELGTFNDDELNAVADRLKLDDYTTASNAEDEDKGYLLISDRAVLKDDIVVITSKTGDDKSQGIFRSKFKLATCGAPMMIEALEGKNIGDIVKVEINGSEHDVELLGIREESVKEEKTELENILDEVDAAKAE